MAGNLNFSPKPNYAQSSKNAIVFRLLICGSVQTRASVGYFSDNRTLWKLKVLASYHNFLSGDEFYAF